MKIKLPRFIKIILCAVAAVLVVIIANYLISLPTLLSEQQGETEEQTSPVTEKSALDQAIGFYESVRDENGQISEEKISEVIESMSEKEAKDKNRTESEQTMPEYEEEQTEPELTEYCSEETMPAAELPQTID